MALIDVLNDVICGAGTGAATGQLACPFDWKRITTIEITPRDYVYGSGSTALATIKLEQQKGNIIILQNVITFTDNTPDPTIITRDGSGIKKVVGELPYEYTATFDSGVNVWKAMRSLNSNGLFNVAFYDEAGNKIMTKNKAGDVKGFGTAMFQVGKYMGSNGVVSSENSLMFQIADFKEVDRQAWIVSVNLDYTPNDLDGVNPVSFVADPISASSTTLVFEARLIDGFHFFAGLTVPKLKVTKNGSPLVPSAIVADATTGKYSLTIPAASAADVYTIQTYDSVAVSNVANVSGALYLSNLATVTAT